MDSLNSVLLNNMDKYHSTDCPEKYRYLMELANSMPCNCPTIDSLYRMYLEKEALKKENKKDTSYRHIWITISLPADIDLKIMKDFDPTILNCNGTETMWVHEFYGKELKYHSHIHLLIRTIKKLDKKRIINKIAKIFEIKSNFIDYKFSNSKLLFGKRSDYVLHEKTDNKKTQVEADKKFRLQHTIDSYYTL